jgi:UDP-N-acetylmuramoylalanine--D-glutamate ligase
MKVLLLGLGRANTAVAKYLLRRGDEVFLFEERLSGLTPEAQGLLADHKVSLYQEEACELVIASPGFPEDKEIVRRLRAQNMPVIDEIEFSFVQLAAPKVVAVTGTNGKSTTAALISRILAAAGVANFLGGNIAPGRPFSQALFEPEYEYYVLEVSSFQLQRIQTFRPRVAVLTNIAVDHLNWHRDFSEYVAAKARIFANQTEMDFAVLNQEDANVRNLAVGIRAQAIYFGPNARGGSWLNDDFHFGEETLFPDRDLALYGRHNRLNVMAAIACAKALKTPTAAIRQGVMDFRSLPHRLEDLGVIAGIRYFNNSMCTNEEAAIRSFEALPGNKVVIVGGRGKGDKCQRYLDLLIREARACVILGENAAEIAEYFLGRGFDRYAIAQDMNDAVEKSRERAGAGDIVILNPGFASFGLFRDFQDRGEAFKHAVIGN